MPDTRTLLSPGYRLGHYEIVEMIGAGGMGQVYRAHDTRLKRDVAIKILLNVFSESESLNRFEREARTASALTHPNVCAVYDVGESDRRPFLVMELLEGKSLRDYINDKPLDVAAALSVATQITDALEAAHAKGIVHRDIKPGNIMITARRHVKVLDFGLAKVTTTDCSPEALTKNSLTAEGIIAGTRHYLAPEVLQGAGPDARSDLWAFGVVLYEMLSGHLPFSGPTAFEITSAIIHEPAPALPAGVPSSLRAIVERCLAKRPEDRYQHAGEVRAALDALQLTPSIPTHANRRRWLWTSGVAAVLAASIFVGPRFFNKTPPRLSSGGPPSANPEANDAFELAMQFQSVQNDLPRGQQMLERALALDPRFAEALRYHATNYAFLLLNGFTNDTSSLYKAEEELRQAARIAPELPGLPAAFAAIYMTQGRKELVPWEQLDRALQQDPSHLNNRLWRGIVLTMAGDNAAAGQEFRTILNQRPLYGPARMFLAQNLREDGDVPGAIREISKVLEQAPTNISAVMILTLSHLDIGEYEKARRLLEDKRPLFSQNYLWRALWALVAATSGDRDEALRTMDQETLKFAAAAFPSTFIVAEFYAVMGEPSKAIEWLERMVRNGDERTHLLRKSPRLAGIRQDPRFEQIISSIESRRKQTR